MEGVGVSWREYDFRGGSTIFVALDKTSQCLFTLIEVIIF